MVVLAIMATCEEILLSANEFVSNWVSKLINKLLQDKELFRNKRKH